MNPAVAELARLLAEIAVDEYFSEQHPPAANDDNHHADDENTDR